MTIDTPLVKYCLNQRISFSELSYLRDIIEYRMESLEIRDRLCRFFELLECYLKGGADRIHFHEIKSKELFWNIRFYYSSPGRNLRISSI